MRRRLLTIMGLFIATIMIVQSAQAGSTIKGVQDRGYVRCGVTDRIPGFSIQGTDGVWSGFFVDFCRAAGAAILGRADAVQIDSYWLDALEGGNVDVMHAGSTWTYTRDTKSHIEFPNVYFYDGQGFMAQSKLGARTLQDVVKLKGLKVCAVGPTSTAKSNLEDFIETQQLDWTIVPMQTMDGMWRAFFGGRCDMTIHDRSALASVHAGRLQDSNDYVVFPEVISKDPLAPAVRDDDVVWRDLVSWITLVTIAAEELDVTSENVEWMKAYSKSPEVRRLLGAEPGIGEGFGLNDDWAYNVIKQVGNFREIFNRNLGPDTPFQLPRGLNALWRDGGLLYAPPLR